MGLANLFEFKVKSKWEQWEEEKAKIRKKIDKIVKDIYRQCMMLGGRVEHKRTYSELAEHLVCVFPEPIDVSRVDFEEREDGEGSFYIESTKGWHGAKVHINGIPVRVEAVGVKGVTLYDNAGGVYSEKGYRKVRKFIVHPTKRAKSIKKVKEVEFYISPDFAHILIR